MASLWFGAVDVALLPSVVRRGLGVFPFWAQLVPSLIGHLVPYAVVAVVFLCGLPLLKDRLSMLKNPALWIGAAVLLLLGPYLWFVADFAFSGPRMIGHEYRVAYVLGLLFVLLIATALGLSLVLWRGARSGSMKVGGLALALVAALLAVNRLVLPDEYEALHGFVSHVALAVCGYGGWEIARTPLATRLSPRSHWPLTVVVGVSGLVGTAALAQSEVLAWSVWSETAGSRYLTVRFALDKEESDRAIDALSDEPARGKPQVEAVQRRARRSSPAPHLIVFSIDNLQADRVGAYGYAKNPTTPNIDRLAKRGAVFRRAYTPYPGTRIFMSTMLTGRRIPALGRHDLPKSYQEASLPKQLDKLGYHVLVKGVFELTAYNDFRPEDYGIDTNLRRATVSEIKKSGTIPHIPLEKRFRKIRQHIKQAAREERPVFIWIHLLQPHRFRGGFVHSKEFPFGSSLSDQYDSAIAATDAWIPKLERLVKKHLSDDGRPTLWVIQSDHGAGMTRATNRETGKSLFEDQVHVPLVLSGAGIAPGVHDILVDAAVDTSATLVDFVGIEPPPSYDGISLVPYLQGRVPAETFSERLVPLRTSELAAGVYDHFKYLRRGNAHSLFDLQADPLERHNLADEEKALLKELRKRVQRELKHQERALERARADDR